MQSNRGKEERRQKNERDASEVCNGYATRIVCSTYTSTKEMVRCTRYLSSTGKRKIRTRTNRTGGTKLWVKGNDRLIDWKDTDGSREVMAFHTDQLSTAKFTSRPITGY
jgi:hypothetical protein